MGSLIVFNARIVDSKIDSNGVVLVQDGFIKSVFLGNVPDRAGAERIALAAGVKSPEYYDAGGLTLMPSFVDMHAHFRYPGQTQKEDLDSALAAAAAGGFGTLVLMPNTNPVLSTRELALGVKKEANSKKIARIFQTVSITKNFEGTDTSGLDNLTSDEFPVISEDGHDVESTAVMLEGMTKAGKKGIIVACHCEDVSLAQAARPYRQRALGFMKQYGIPAGKVNVKIPDVPESVDFEIDGNLTAANALLALAEDTATLRNIEIAKLAGCHIHICHCSTKISMDGVRRAKAEIANGTTRPEFDCTVEVTPHHLGLAGTDAPFIRALVNPPLRSEEDRRAVIEALRDGTADCIGTDHAPHTQEDKAGGSPGFTGLETAFGVCNSILVKKEGFSLSRLSELMSDNPAKILKIKSGRIAPDYTGDFVLLDPDEEWIVHPEFFKSKGKSTPLEGRTLTGKIHATFFGGKKVYGK